MVVTHELELCFDISDRVALLKDGRLVACGPAREIRDSESPEVRDFLGGGGGSLEADSVWITGDAEGEANLRTDDSVEQGAGDGA